jgi:hypothetical protein
MKKIVAIEEEEEDDFRNGVDFQAVLDSLGLMTEAQLAALYDCGRDTMRNRPKSELPPFFRAGGKRYYFKEDIVRFFKNRTNAP